MRPLLFFIVLLVLELYAFQIVRFFAGNWSNTWKWIVFASYWALSAFFFLWIIFNDHPFFAQINKDALTYLRGFFMMIYTAKLFAIIPLLADDIRRIGLWLFDQFKVNSEGFDPSRSRFLLRTAAVFGSVPFLTLGYGMLRNAYRYKVYEADIALDDLPADLEGLRIVQISDIHAGSFTFTEPVKQAVKLINDLKPDLVFFTGDLVNDKAAEMKPYLPIFSNIKAKYGVYSVMGNHDYGNYTKWSSDEEKEENQRAFRQLHKTMGWQLLRNATAMIDIGNASIGILGVENISAKRYFPKYGDLPSTYEQCADCDLKILLSHDPSHWNMEVTKDFHDIDITLSGHTHGFQFGIEIPGFVKWSPSQYVYDEWAGLYQKGKQYLYVNRGLGFLGYPGRVGILPEISSLTLRKRV